MDMSDRPPHFRKEIVCLVRKDLKVVLEYVMDNSARHNAGRDITDTTPGGVIQDKVLGGAL